MNQDLTFLTPQTSILPEGTTDDMLIEMWLHDAALSTKDGYHVDIQQFRDFVQTPLQRLTLLHIQQFKDELSSLGLTTATVSRKLKAVKSLLSFAKKTGYTSFNVGVMVKLPREKNRLAERILSEEQVMSMIFREPTFRNYVLLRLLYTAGLRVSELCDLKWRDIQPRGETGQVTIFGKGDKTRVIILKKETYQEVIKLRHEASQDTPVFRSRGGGHAKAGGKLDPSQILRIVRAAAQRAGIEGKVSPHWLRHAHASHAIEKGASITLVKETLGHESMETTAGYLHAHPDKSSAQFLI